MQLERLSILQFRNIDTLAMEFHPKLTILLGPNGSGKTNILEAISLLSLPRSFRGGKDSQLIQWNNEYARVTGVVLSDNGQSDELSVYIEKFKRLTINNRPVKTHEFIGQFWSIVFAPEDVDLLQGSPGQRRAFLDAFLSLVNPRYFQHLVLYQRVLMRRNKLLADHVARLEEFVYWNDEQIEHGAFIVQARQTLLQQLEEYLPHRLRFVFHSQLIDDGDVKITFQRKQANIFERERAVGYSLVGPQRDDFSLFEKEQERDMGQFGSRGEQRMCVILLKQAQLAYMSRQGHKIPVFLLDDVLSELDASNQDQLIRSLGDQQTILSTASLTDVSPTLLDDAFIYEKADKGWIRHS